MKRKYLIKNSLSILSFLILLLLSLSWFFLNYWRMPQYEISILTLLNNGLNGLSWIFGQLLYFIGFFPLIISLIIIIIEFIFLKRENKILKVCLSVSLVFILSIAALNILTVKSTSYMSKFNTQNWTNLPDLRYESVNNLITTHNLVGLSISSLFALLGSQDYETSNYDSKTYFWDLKNPLNIDNSYITVTVSKDKVISYKIISNSSTN